MSLSLDNNDDDHRNNSVDEEEEFDKDENDNEAETDAPFKLSLEATEDFNEKLKKRGVVYVARIPPRMTPTKLKALLSQYGEVNRIYLAEEDATVRKRRRKLSGNGSKRYIEGWVEFESKKVAKQVASKLNMQPISQRKRDTHYGDLWMLKYLSKFQWSHLTEKVAYERRVREQKLRLETMQARKETATFKQLVEKGKQLEKAQKRTASKEGDGPSHKKMRKPRHQVMPLSEEKKKPGKAVLLGALV